jgi:glycosyltransferase involved in cell wall biosynthesis
LISKNDLELSRSIRKQDMIEDRKIQLLCVSRLDPEKGLDHLIRAMQILRQQNGQEFELQMVGSGQMAQSLRGQVSQLGLDQNVHFHGYVPHSEYLLDLYRMASVFILHSLTEGVPQVLLEAMACGVPIIATKVGGIPHIITDGFNGLLIAPAVPRQISDAVLRLIADKPLRERLAANAFQVVLKHTLEAERDGMLTVLQQYRLWPQ